MIERNNYIPPFLRGVEGCFITEESQSNRLLGKVWEILDNLCPAGTSSEVSLEVPCQTLVNLGLVSRSTEGEITGIISRKKRKDFADEPKNKISFKRTGENEITLNKTYLTEERTELDFTADDRIESPFRIDKVIREVSILRKESNGYWVEMRTKVDNEHLHAKDKRWVVTEAEIDENWQKVEAGLRDYNRMLALIIEGLIPGYLGDQKLL